MRLAQVVRLDIGHLLIQRLSEEFHPILTRLNGGKDYVQQRREAGELMRDTYLGVFLPLIGASSDREVEECVRREVFFEVDALIPEDRLWDLWLSCRPGFSCY